MLTIAVDAMGGDHAPKSEVEGAIEAARVLGIRVILVGRSELLLRTRLEQHREFISPCLWKSFTPTNA